MDLSHHIFLAAEAAAHQLPDHAHTLFGPAHHTRHLLAVLIGDLRADINLHPSIRKWHSDTTFRLQEGVVSRGSVEDMLQDDVRLGKAFVHVALTDFDMLEH